MSVNSMVVQTSRLKMHLLSANPEGNVPVILVHGNVSSSAFFDQTLASLPAQYRCIAPDLRGFGGSEALPVDATRGLRDFSDDLFSLLEALNLAGKVHLAGWSVGGGVVMQFAMDHPERVASLLLIAPVSPYGFGGTKDAKGIPCYADFAGSGGGTANPEFVRLLAAGERGSESATAPRNVMNSFYFKPPFRVAPEREEAFLSAMLSTLTGPGNYPGDLTASPNWPTVAPGLFGINNAISPKYMNLSGFAGINPKPPVLWIRGADDQIVSDTSLFDLGFLGQLGAVPGWPGAEAFPPQPMITQTRAVLEAYRANGGAYTEEVLAEAGHSPHIEQPERFQALLYAFLGQHR